MTSIRPSAPTLSSYLEAARAGTGEPARNEDPKPSLERGSMTSPLSSTSDASSKRYYLTDETQKALIGNLNRISTVAQALRNEEIQTLAESGKKWVVTGKIEALTETPQELKEPSQEALNKCIEKLPAQLKQLALAGDMSGIMSCFSKLNNGARLDCLPNLIRYFDRKECLGSYWEPNGTEEREVATLPALLSQIDHKKTTREEIEKVEMGVFAALKSLSLERALPGLDGMLLHLVDSIQKSWKPMLVVLKEEGGEAKVRSALNHSMELYKLAHAMATEGVSLTQRLKDEIGGTKASPLVDALKKDLAIRCKMAQTTLEGKMEREAVRVKRLKERLEALLINIKCVQEHLRATEAHLAISITTLNKREPLVQTSLWNNPKIDEDYWSHKFIALKKTVEPLSKTEDFVPYKDLIPSASEVLTMAVVLCSATKSRRVEHENDIKNKKMDEGAKKRVREELKSNLELYNVLVGQAEKIKSELKQRYNRLLKLQASQLTQDSVDAFSKHMGLPASLIELRAGEYNSRYKRKQESYQAQVKALRALEDKLRDVKHELAIALQTLREGKQVLMKGTLFGGEAARIESWATDFESRRTEIEKTFSTEEEPFLIQTYDPYKEEKIVDESSKKA